MFGVNTPPAKGLACGEVITVANAKKPVLNCHID
jgi:hypothetical protein